MPFHGLCCRLSVVLQPCVSLTIGALAYVNKWALQNVYQFQLILGNQKISRFLIGEQAPVEATADAFRVPLSMTYLRNCHPRPYQCPTTEINSLVLDAVFLPSDSANSPIISITALNSTRAVYEGPACAVLSRSNYNFAFNAPSASLVGATSTIIFPVFAPS